MVLDSSDWSWFLCRHPAEFDAGKYAARYAGQLRLYRKAVEAATGKTVRQTVIHLPNLGMCFEVK